MSKERQFTEREVMAIIERAVEHQREAPRRAAEHGPTLGEIERIGREVGIAPEHMRRPRSR